MNIENLNESLDLLSYHGITLSPEQKLLIENSLTLLQAENKFKQIFFWGRLEGFYNDYYIAFGYMKDCLYQRKFFYSTNCYKWVFLPLPKLELLDASLICPDMFYGDPTMEIVIELDPKFTMCEDQTWQESEPKFLKLREEHRLSCIVNAITSESALIPRGGLYKLFNKNIIYNPMFKGLDEIIGPDLTNYVLYRPPNAKFNQNLLKRPDYNYAIDFLDTADDQIPDSCSFSVNLERGGTVVLIRSLLWLGMVFFHKLNTEKHGFAYFGNGKKNLDLLFMVAGDL